MSNLVDSARVTLKVGTYGIAPAAALADPLYVQQVQAYRRRTGARTMALDKYGSKKRIPSNDDYFISRKIDGEFTVLVYEDGEAITVNPGGTVRVGAEFMAEAAKELEKAGVKQALICGELFVARPDGKRPRVHDVTRVARNPTSAEEAGQLRFAVFDVMEIDREPAPAQYEKVWKWINEVFDTEGLVHPVQTVIGNNEKLCECYEKWVEGEGAEGIVARSDETGFYKVKPRHNLDVAVIGFAEGVDDRAGMLHDLLLAVVRKDGSYHLMGRVGGGFKDEQRVQFLEELRELVVESEYAEINSDHVAYEMVRPEWVVEISCLDLISQTTRGGSIDRMVLDWNAETDAWETVRRLPLVSVISPQFVRKREDKTPGPVDTRLAQLTDLVEIEKAEATAEDLQLPRSEIIKRVVYTKTAKEKTMVRKLVMWKTNKEEQSRDFPAYVLHYTDFSPNRKDPLDREIRVSSSREQMDELWQELAEGAFKKGWNVETDAPS